ncbi:MAG: riboflavin synthase [Saprospiraceae bacterium]|nr:riboflavin synthase [Saprospiraceae bacterium]
MFTGIIESLGHIKSIEKEGSNVHFTIESSISNELKIDQSLSHNGVCLTVVALGENTHTVTAIEETLQRSNIGQLQTGDAVNLERAMVSNGRLDGHIVQGHVDGTGICKKIEEVEGSWYFTFEYEPTEEHLLVDKGSVCINGVSLTVVNPVDRMFSVAIIPYTYEHTTFKNIKVGDKINLEFDVIGKYISRYVKLYMKAQ